MKRLIAVAAAGMALLSGCAVIPSVQWQHSTFEGFEVISYVPEHPKGMVYVFHGTNGSAAFAERVETTDVINRLVSRGYGFVSTSSTERTGNRRWLVTDPSLTTNPDLARLARLQAHLVATTGRADRADRLLDGQERLHGSSGRSDSELPRRTRCRNALGDLRVSGAPAHGAAV